MSTLFHAVDAMQSIVETREQELPESVKSPMAKMAKLIVNIRSRIPAKILVRSPRQQKGMVGAAIDGIRRFYWYCRNLLLGRKRLKLVLSRQPFADQSGRRSTALTIVNKSRYRPSFENCVLPRHQPAVVVYSDFKKLTKLKSLIRPNEVKIDIYIDNLFSMQTICSTCCFAVQLAVLLLCTLTLSTPLEINCLRQLLASSYYRISRL